MWYSRVERKREIEILSVLALLMLVLRLGLKNLLHGEGTEAIEHTWYSIQARYRQAMKIIKAVSYPRLRTARLPL
jgi:hypothetical protein